MNGMHLEKRNHDQLNLIKHYLFTSLLIRERGFKGTICTSCDAVTHLVVAVITVTSMLPLDLCAH